MTRLVRFVHCAAFVLAAVSHLSAQEPLTVERAVALAAAQYPSVQVSTEQIHAAAAAVSAARTAYLPRLDFLAQANRATRNNVFGMLLPQSTIAPISGPALGLNSLTSVWGSAVGLLLSWEPFDFGRRGARVATAEAGQRRAEAARALTRFEVSTLAADAFLTALAAQQTLVSAEAGVERARSIAAIVRSLVNSQLRPGADLSRAEAELALAETQAIRSRQAIREARVSLEQLAGDVTQLNPGRLLQTAPQDAVAGAAQHPAIVERAAAAAEEEARLAEIRREYRPKLLLQGASYARGTGAVPDGTTLGGLNGLGPNIHNWGVALTATFPILDLPSIRHRTEEQQFRVRAERARQSLVKRELEADVERARARLEGAREIAAKIPVQVAAARATLDQATARYRAGLGNIVDVAEAQQLLTQAETDDSIARLQVWRGLLAVAAAQGDLEPFLRAAAQ